MSRFVGLVLGLCLAGWSARAQEVRIISIDGKFLDGPRGTIEVWPGQVVSLVADEVFRDGDGNLDYAYRPVEDFLWLARDGSSTACDPRTDCRRETRFEVTDYGVNYYVPQDGPRSIRIEVRARDGEGSDSLVLRRADRIGAFEDRLTGLGWWTWIGEDRVFIPYAYVDDWDPYTRGYWYWTSLGWTWYSYDPWGPVTDHYGHWRHHGVYGWVWVPDPLWVWRPAVVSFFFLGDFVGWWPYDSGWHQGYRHGYANGYDDGYWSGYWAGRRDARREDRRHHGAVMVRTGDFYAPDRHPSPPGRGGRGPAASQASVDLSKVLVRDRGQVSQTMEGAIQRGAVGPVPGGGKDPAAGRAFIARQTGIEPQEVPLKRVSVGPEGRQGFEPARPVFEAPAEYRNLSTTIRERLGAGKAEGPGIRASLADSVVRTAARPERSRPDRGVAMPPTKVGEGRQVLQRWAPRDLGGGGAGTLRVDPQRGGSAPEVRERRDRFEGRDLSTGGSRSRVSPDAVRPERPVPGRDTGIDESSPRPVQRSRPTWSDPEVRSPRPDVPERPRRSPEPEVSPWRSAPAPEMRREVPERSVPRPSEMRREVPERSVPRPSEMRREVPERSVPRPSEMRREVPERDGTPSRSSGPAFRPAPAPSSGSQSAPPPTYVPPRPRDSGRGLPGRSGPFRR